MQVGLETDAPVMLGVDEATSDEEEKSPAGLMEIMEEEEETVSGVISDQPVSHGPPCCQLLSVSSGQESEPNNNHAHKLPQIEAMPLINVAPPSLIATPPSNPAAPPPSTVAALVPGDGDLPKTASEGVGEQAANAGVSRAHNAAGAQEEAASAAPKVARGSKRHSVKLRERLFHFPLCEKALAFNLPSHNKPKILPLAQYNCCHVL